MSDEEKKYLCILGGLFLTTCGIWGYLWGKKLSKRADDTSTKITNEDYANYKIAANEICIELHEIYLKYCELSHALSQLLPPKSNSNISNSFFVQKYNACTREDSEREELSNRLTELFQTYPKLNIKNMMDTGYIRMVQVDLDNHHKVVKEVFQRYLELVNSLVNSDQESKNTCCLLEP